MIRQKAWQRVTRGQGRGRRLCKSEVSLFLGGHFLGPMPRLRQGVFWAPALLFWGSSVAFLGPNVGLGKVFSGPWRGLFWGPQRVFCDMNVPAVGERVMTLPRAVLLGVMC